MSKLFIATLFIFMMNKSHAVTITINGQNQQPLANAVVWLTATDNSLSTLPVSSPFTMTQKERQFTPHILVVPKNAQVEFPNAGSIMHHVYSFSSAKSFELKLYREQPQAPIRFEQTGVVELGCNIHDWMLGYIVVVDSPFYGVTNNQGQIELTPDHGEFKFNVWHEGFSDISQTESKTITLSSAAIVYQIGQSIVPRITIGVDEFDDYE